MRTVLITCAAFAVMAGAATAETRDVGRFVAVSATDRVPVEIVRGDSYSVEVIGQDASRVRTEIDDGALEIGQRNRSWFGNPARIDARVRVTTPSIERIAASRGASVRAEDIEADDMSLAAAMGGSIDISGRCRSLSASAAMGGSIDADAFQCVTANISAAMGGDADVYASSAFDASASMGGSISVGGNPTDRDVSTAMGGSVSTR
jgi:hypothetical protein